MIYYALDAVWEDNKSVELGNYLSGANPFLFDDVGSADPAIYNAYCKMVSGGISVENSYDIAKRYVESLNNKELCSAFMTISKSEWYDCLKEYLSKDHKGSVDISTIE